MPNYDAGHYFLTVLAPIRLDSVLIDGQSHSRRHLIRERLAAMPTGERTGASIGTGGDALFARNTRTHFARFVVLDDVVFNGRVSGDTLLERVKDLVLRRNSDPLIPQPVDRLSTPFLIFDADFDAQSGDDSELKSYLTELWATMGDELTAIFSDCVGFESVGTADAFFAYIKKCQVETTMPFNDYWSAPLNVPDLDVKPYGIAALVAVAVAVLAFVVGVVMCGPRARLMLLSLGGLVALVVIAFLAYRKVMTVGNTPFPKSPPPAPASDLPTILKALYLQRAFTDLAVRMQGRSDEELYTAFGAFMVDNQPGEVAAPAQKPAVFGIESEGRPS
jgi:hypothetical protein